MALSIEYPHQLALQKTCRFGVDLHTIHLVWGAVLKLSLANTRPSACLRLHKQPRGNLRPNIGELQTSLQGLYSEDEVAAKQERPPTFKKLSNFVRGASSVVVFTR